MPVAAPPTIANSFSAPNFVCHRALLDEFPTMVWCCDAAGNCTYSNGAFMAFTGDSLAGPEDNDWLDSVHPEDQEVCRERFAEAIRSRQPFELEYRRQRQDGIYRWLIHRGAPVHAGDRFFGFVAFCFDCTDRREADAARRDVEEQVRLLSLATHDLVWSWDARTGRVIHNVAFSEMLGEVPGPRQMAISWWRQRVHAEDRGRVTATFMQALQTGASEVFSEYRIRRRNGALMIVDDRACLVRDEHGRLLRVLGAMRDISKRKAAEQERERLVRILEATTDVVGMSHPDGHIIHLNQAGRKLLGRPLAGPLVGFNVSECHPDWANEIVFKEAIPYALAEGVWSGETALLSADGHEVPVLQVIIAHPSADGKVEFISTIMRDISERKRAEVARMEAANRYDAAVRASGQLLFDWNSFTNEITYAGDVARFFGYAMHEMAGGLDRFRQLVHPDDLPAFEAEVARVTATRDPFRLTYRMFREDGREMVVDAKGYFFLDRQGDFGRMVGFLADVTLQQYAQEALARAHEGLEYRVAERTAELARANAVIQHRARQQEAVAHLGQRALAGAPAAEIFQNASAVVRETLGVEFCSVLQLSKDKRELLVVGSAGWPDDTLFNRIPAELQSQSGYTLLAGEPVIAGDLTQETRFCVSESVRWVGGQSAISVIIHTGEVPFGVLCAIAVQRRNFTQDDVHFLQSVANVLTAAITRQRAEESVRLAREQAKTANRAKSEFLSRMSHELRTPLNAILGFTQILEMDSPTPNQAESISHISRGGTQLLGLINQVLDIARIDTGRLFLTSELVNLSEVIHESIELIRPLAERHAIEVNIDPSCDADLSVTADRQRLKQVFLNILSNAVKYNCEKGSVTVTAERTKDRVRIRIRDTGPGIPPEKMARLFIPFERLGAESTSIEGMGIGLALAHRIVSSLQGRLTAECVVGEGSTFSVELVALAVETAEYRDPATTAENAPLPVVPTRTILYVEDEDLNLRLVERILMLQPELRLISAMQGSLGLELAREHQPDLILLDLNLPDLSGDEVLRRLKADPALREIPVIMVSADALGDRIKQLLSLGAYNYLTKPYKVGDFLKVVNDALAAFPA